MSNPIVKGQGMRSPRSTCESAYIVAAFILIAAIVIGAEVIAHILQG